MLACPPAGGPAPPPLPAPNGAAKAARCRPGHGAGPIGPTSSIGGVRVPEPRNPPKSRVLPEAGNPDGLKPVIRGGDALAHRPSE